MKNTLQGFARYLSSLLVFGAVTLTIAAMAYQVFSPDGRIFLWINELWSTNPMLLLVLGGMFLLLKRWLDGYNPSKDFANALVYLTAMAGMVAGINWLAYV